jgi:hypothetical protein
MLNGTPVATITVPRTGMHYDQGVLFLQDSLKRFCTEGGKHPIVSVDFRDGNPSLIGVHPTYTVDNVAVADIPLAAKRGMYDVVVQTPEGCKGNPLKLRLVNAVTYGG